VLETPINSKTELTEQVKSTEEVSAEALSLSTVEPKPEDFRSRLEYSAACHTAGVLPKSRRALKSVLPREEFELVKEQEKVARGVEEWKAERAAQQTVAEAKQ
jgi:hypothetical protein